MALLAVDAGRSEVEVKSMNGIKVFPSAVSEAVRVHNPQLLEGDLEIEVDGQKWWVGNLAEREGSRFKRNNFGDSKADPILKVQVIAAAIYSGLASGSIELGILVPVEGYTKEERKKLGAILKGRHEITYNLVEEAKKPAKNKSCILTIEDKILIAQEGAAAYWSQPQKEDTQTFDFGAQTVNYVYHEYKNGQSTYVNDFSGTIQEGWEILKRSNPEIGVSRDEHLEEEELVKLASSLAQKAIDEVNLKGWSKRVKTQVFGGVAHLVFPYIKKAFPKAVMPHSPRNGNVEGLYNLMEEVFSYV